MVFSFYKNLVQNYLTNSVCIWYYMSVHFIHSQESCEDGNRNPMIPSKSAYFQGIWNGHYSNTILVIQVLVIITIRAGSSPVSRTT